MTCLVIPQGSISERTPINRRSSHLTGSRPRALLNC